MPEVKKFSEIFYQNQPPLLGEQAPWRLTTGALETPAGCGARLSLDTSLISKNHHWLLNCQLFSLGAFLPGHLCRRMPVIFD